MNLLPNCEITLVQAATGSGTTTITSSPVDMQGYEGVIFFTVLGTANAANVLSAVQDTVVGLGSVADLAGSALSSGASDEVLKLEIVKPLERYVAAKVTRGSATTIGEIWAIRYGARTSPKNAGVSGTSASKTVVSPAEGTP